MNTTRREFLRTLAAAGILALPWRRTINTYTPPEKWLRCALWDDGQLISFHGPLSAAINLVDRYGDKTRVVVGYTTGEFAMPIGMVPSLNLALVKTLLNHPDVGQFRVRLNWDAMWESSRFHVPWFDMEGIIIRDDRQHFYHYDKLLKIHEPPVIP